MSDTKANGQLRTLPGAGPVNEIVKMLEEWVDIAKRGDAIAIAVVSVRRSGEIAHQAYVPAANTWQLVGAIEDFKHDFLHSVNS